MNAKRQENSDLSIKDVDYDVIHKGVILSNIKENDLMNYFTLAMRYSGNAEYYYPGCEGCQPEDFGGNYGDEPCRCLTYTGKFEASSDDITAAVFNDMKKEPYNDETFGKACFELMKLVDKYGLSDGENYHLESKHDYYGEEITGVYFLQYDGFYNFYQDLKKIRDYI